MTTTFPTASVVIPAHDEEATIAGTLETLTRHAEPGEFEIVVVCNGCTDDTARIARSHPAVEVVEIETPSKIAALREGDRRASRFPRIYLDADVPLPTQTARALTQALDGEAALTASVRGRMDLSSSPLLVQLFYEFRQRLPVFANGGIGAGVYALSQAGRARIGDWPELRSGDDQFILRTFAPHERVTLTGHDTTIEPPADLRAVVRRGVRTRRGSTSLDTGASGRPLAHPPAGVVPALKASLGSPRDVGSAIVFVAVTVVIRAWARLGRGGADWASYQSLPGRRSPRQGSSVDRNLAPAEPRTTRPTPAVVIVTYNAAQHVPELLTSVRAGLDDPSPEIVVVDNGSRDETVRLARAQPDVRVIEQTNTGFAHGINRGIEASSEGRDILVLNPDVRLEPGAVRRLAQVLNDHPDVGVVVPTLVDTQGNVLPSLRRDPSTLRTLAETVVGGSRAGRFGESYPPTAGSGPVPVDWATGAVMLLRRSVVDALGGLDERFFLYSEETEYCQRVREAGYRVVCVPAARVVHAGGQLHENPTLWALRAVNRVRRHRLRSGPLPGVAFRAASWAFELRRALSGRSTSELAVRALLSRDLDAAATTLIHQLGGEPPPPPRRG